MAQFGVRKSALVVGALFALSLMAGRSVFEGGEHAEHEHHRRFRHYSVLEQPVRPAPNEVAFMSMGPGEEHGYATTR